MTWRNLMSFLYITLITVFALMCTIVGGMYLFRIAPSILERVAVLVLFMNAAYVTGKGLGIVYSNKIDDMTN